MYVSDLNVLNALCLQIVAAREVLKYLYALQILSSV
jgi:hypothetical protein